MPRPEPWWAKKAMIDPRVVREFLNRSFDSFEHLKEVPEAEIDDALVAIGARREVIKRLRFHQKVCFLLGVAYPQFAFWLDMGTGKTLLSLELLLFWMLKGTIARAVVLTPTDEVAEGWEDSIKEWMPGAMPCVLLTGSSDDKWKTLAEIDEGLAVVSYQGLVTMVSDLAPIKGKKKNRLKPELRWIDDLTAGVGALVLDESTNVGNYDSLWYRVARAISKRVTVRYALAGMPFGRDPTMMWAQYYLLDHGETMGLTLELFREALFTKKKNQWSKSRYSFEYKFDKKNSEMLNRMIGHRSIAFASAECLDLPALVPIISRVSFPTSTEAYYAQVVKEVIAAKGNYHLMNNAFLRLRQVSSGFLGFRDDETGERAEIEFKDNPKLARLMEYLDEMPWDCKAIVFHEFTWTGRRISRELTAAKIGHGWIWGGTADASAEKRRFIEDDRCRVMLLNNKKGNYGLDYLSIANYVHFFESPVACIDRAQAEKRAHRDGQKRTVFQYDLVVRGSMDERILAFHKEGADLFKLLIRDPGAALTFGLKRSGSMTKRESPRRD